MDANVACLLRYGKCGASRVCRVARAETNVLSRKQQTHYQMLCQVQMMIDGHDHDAQTKALVLDGATISVRKCNAHAYGIRRSHASCPDE